MKDFVGFIAAPRRRRNPLNVRHPSMTRVVYAFHILVGLVVASLGLWLCWWAPSTSPKENSYWSGLTVIVAIMRYRIADDVWLTYNVFSICSWCYPEYLAWLWLVSNESQGINCDNIYSHSFVWIQHLLHLWRQYVRWSHAHLLWCIWWTLCHRMQCADRSIDLTPICNARADSMVQ